MTVEGQFSIFDVIESKRPCEYKTQRFIGQRCKLQNGVYGTVTAIGKYYTDVAGDDGEEYAGTPYCHYFEKGEIEG